MMAGWRSARVLLSTHIMVDLLTPGTHSHKRRTGPQWEKKQKKAPQVQASAAWDKVKDAVEAVSRGRKK